MCEKVSRAEIDLNCPSVGCVFQWIFSSHVFVRAEICVESDAARFRARHAFGWFKVDSFNVSVNWKWVFKQFAYIWRTAAVGIWADGNGKPNAMRQSKIYSIGGREDKRILDERERLRLTMDKFRSITHTQRNWWKEAFASKKHSSLRLYAYAAFRNTSKFSIAAFLQRHFQPTLHRTSNGQKCSS